MIISWKQVKVHLRTSLVVMVAFAIAMVLFMNRNNTVSFWFFGLTDTDKKINVVGVIVSTAAATRLAWWVFSLGWGIWRDMKELQVEQQKEREQQANQVRENRLSDMERRIDDKVDQLNESGTQADTDEEKTDLPQP